jgi:hypothetical protein
MVLPLLLSWLAAHAAHTTGETATTHTSKLEAATTT